MIRGQEARPIVDLRLIEEHLAVADRHIAEAELRLARLRALKSGDPKTAAMTREMIAGFARVLETMHVHRQIMFAERADAQPHDRRSP